MRRPFNPEKEILDYCKHICNANIQTRRNNSKTKTWYWDYPAMASVCYDRTCMFKSTGFSHYPNRTVFVPELKLKLEQLGQIGKKSNRPGNRYTIGNCAEQHAGNHFMKEHNETDLHNLYFSCAMRPRTKQPYEPCENCKDTFPNL